MKWNLVIGLRRFSRPGVRGLVLTIACVSFETFWRFRSAVVLCADGRTKVVTYHGLGAMDSHGRKVVVCDNGTGVSIMCFDLNASIRDYAVDGICEVSYGCRNCQMRLVSPPLRKHNSYLNCERAFLLYAPLVFVSFDRLTFCYKSIFRTIHSSSSVGHSIE